MAQTLPLVKDKPNGASIRQPGIIPQSRRQWRLVRRVIVFILGFAGIWTFWVDRFWVNQVQDKLLDRPSSSPMSATETARMQEVAHLMLVIYKTLSEMRYLSPESIITGPHNISHNQHTFDALGLDPSIVYLYSILPYIDTDKGGQEDFFQGGRFIDYRDEADVVEGRDPFYADPDGTDFDAANGPYMRPWMTPLSLLGNHQSVIIYDSRKHTIWIIDQEGWSSSDPAFESAPDRSSQSRNENTFEHIHSRFAPDVLKDINSWYRRLELLPGGGENSGREWEHFDMDLATLYSQNGWPDDFRGDDFQADQLRKRCANTAKHQAEEPLMKVSDAQRWVKYVEEQAEKLKKQIMEFQSDDEQWMAEFGIWKHKRDIDCASSHLRQAREAADKYCPEGICQKPEDLPLWELECVKEEYARKRMEYEDEEQKAKNETDTTVFRAKNKLFIWSNALTASKAAADRLRPGATLDAPPRDRGDRSERIDMARKDVVGMTQFLSGVPKRATGARSSIESEIEDLQRRIDSWEQDRARQLEWEKMEREKQEKKKTDAAKEAH